MKNPYVQIDVYELERDLGGHKKLLADSLNVDDSQDDDEKLAVLVTGDIEMDKSRVMVKYKFEILIDKKEFANSDTPLDFIADKIAVERKKHIIIAFNDKLETLKKELAEYIG